MSWFPRDLPGTPLSNALDMVEFVLFIIPRGIQHALDALFALGMLSGPTAMGVYTALTYAAVAVLLYVAARSFGACFWSGALVIGSSTYKPMLRGAFLVLLAAFTAMAPTTGLSTRHCTVAVAPFVTFDR